MTSREHFLRSYPMMALNKTMRFFVAAAAGAAAAAADANQQCRPSHSTTSRRLRHVGD